MWQLWLILGGIVLLLVLVIVLTIMFKVVRKIMKYVALFMILVSIVSVFFGYLVYKDVMDLKENFLERDNLFILYKDDRLLTGFSMKFSGLTEMKDSQSLKYLSQDQINEYDGYFKNKEYDKILGDNYKIFFISYVVFNDSDKIDFGEDKFSSEFILSMLESDNPAKVYQEELVGKGSAAEIAGVPENFKANIFIALLSKRIMQDKGPWFLITEMKNDNIKVYPETITFKVIGYIPTDFIIDKLSDIAGGLGVEEG